MFEGVLFDFSGTLFDDGSVLAPADVVAEASRHGVQLDLPAATRLCELALAHADSSYGRAARKGSDRSARANREIWTRLIVEAFRKRDPDVASGADSSVLAEVLYACLTRGDSWDPYPDAVPVLHAIHDAGLRVGVLSNIAWDIRSCFRRIGAMELIDAFVLSFEHGVVKPERDLFLAGCAALGTKPGVTLYVGDDPATDGGAIRAGLPVYLLPHDRHRDRPRGLTAILPLTGASD